jgi:hypothetical protein
MPEHASPRWQHRLKQSIRRSQHGAVLPSTVAIVAAFLSASCTGMFEYVPYRTYQGSPRPLESIVVVAKGDTPNCETDVIGSARGAIGDGPSPLEKMRAKAAALGADGIKDYYCGAPGTTGEHYCTGLIYLCKQ